MHRLTSSQISTHFTLQVSPSPITSVTTLSQTPSQKKKFYKRSTFVTHLPMNYLYSPTHAWAEEIAPKRWRVGITKFATRMLGEMVDLGFELNQGDPIKHGQIIGWLEGFKAISDLYAVINGQFVASNPLLEKAISGVSDSPYQDGWLYEAKGEPDPRCMAVDDYAGLLDSTIDKILEQQASDS